MQAALAIVLTDELEIVKGAIKRRDQFNPFIVEAGFRVNHRLCTNFKLRYVDKSMWKIIKKVEMIGYFVSSISDSSEIYRRKLLFNFDR